MMESQALKLEGTDFPLEAAKPTRRNPAGMRRKAETKNGPYLGSTSFMATMAVPQKKNGETNTVHSHSASARQGIDDEDESVSNSVFSVFTRHSTSCPVPTQSTSSGGGAGESGKAVLLEHGTLNRREGGAAVERRQEEGGNVRVWMRNWDVME